LQLANAALDHGKPVAVIDADLGQSEIGPPGTVGLAMPEAPAEAASEWAPVALAFVGATSPAGRLLDLVVGVRRLADEARRRGAELILVDTSGLVQGALALKLKLAKLEVLQPDTVMALRRGTELDPVLRLVPAACRAAVVAIAPSHQAHGKPPALRRARRAAQFTHYLRDARPHEIDRGQVLFADGWLFTGRPLAPKTLTAAGKLLGRKVLYGEDTADGVRLVTCGTVTPLPQRELKELFGSQRAAATPASVFQNLLVGLLEEGGRLAEIGLVERVDFTRGRLRILSPLRTEGALRVVRYGRLRIRMDGTEIGPVRPGDL
jgi:polynucleotide 5'-hydroxyl-kinase GRC3/NOL9